MRSRTGRVIPGPTHEAPPACWIGATGGRVARRHARRSGANDQGAVKEAPGAALLAFRFLQLHAFAVRLEQGLATDDEGRSRFVHQDRCVLVAD
eukprot:2800289-Alexandrium_andersonii.AAC.1